MIVENAIKIAKKAHEGQFRKWGKQPTPYIIHPLRVAARVAALPGANEIDVAAAHLHDVLEDCGEHWAEVIEKECGAEVLALVRELTLPTEGPEWKNKPRAEKNKVRYDFMKKTSDRAKRIKLCDRIDNIQDMDHAPFKLRQKIIPESEKLIEILGYVDEILSKELKESIEEMSRKVNASSD